MKQSAAIIGMGIVSGLGRGVEATFERMLAGKVGIRPISRFSTEAYAQRNAGQLAEDDELRLLDMYRDDDLAWGLIYDAAGEAMATLGTCSPDDELGLVLATNFGIMESLCWCWQERLDTAELHHETFLAQQDVVETVAQRMGAGGPRLQLSLSCASGAAALTVGLEWLREGRASRVLVIGYDVLSEFVWCGLSNLRTITTDCIRPFDRRRQGTIFSEGAAAMLLSSRELDRHCAMGWLLGGATNNNAFHMTAPPKEAEGSRQAMAAALADATIEPSQIDLVCAHATGTSANDSTESAAIDNLLGRPVPVAAFKSSLGHLLGAAGLAEAIMTMQALRTGIVPAVQGLEQLDPACTIDVVRGKPRRGSFEVAITNSAGIGGNNSALVLSRDVREQPEAVVAPRGVQVRRWGWVLPGEQQAGGTLPEVDITALLGANALLADFSAKEYLKSIKGYMDPVSAFTLAAVSLVFGEELSHKDTHARFAVVGVSQYGAPTSGYHFHEMMRTKGPRLASPLIFPHGYANTAPNLVAIEYNLSGPHMVINNATDCTEAWWWACHLLRAGLADDVLLIAGEAVQPHVIPDDVKVLNGALACWLRAGEAEDVPRELERTPHNLHGTVWSALNAFRGVTTQRRSPTT